MDVGRRVGQITYLANTHSAVMSEPKVGGRTILCPHFRKLGYGPHDPSGITASWGGPRNSSSGGGGVLGRNFSRGGGRVQVRGNFHILTSKNNSEGGLNTLTPPPPPGSATD